MDHQSSASVEQVLVWLQQEEKLVTIKERLDWGNVAPETREEFFQRATELAPTETGRLLLQVLYTVTNQAGHTWDMLRALALVTSRCSIPIDTKRKTLARIRAILNNQEERISKERDARQTRYYQQYDAEYYLLAGKLSREEDKPEEAIRLTQTALDKFLKLGMKEHAAYAQDLIEKIKKEDEQRENLIPLAELAGERDRIAADLAHLQEERRQSEADYEQELTHRLEENDRIQQQSRQLFDQLEQYRAEHTQLQNEIAERKTELNDLQNILIQLKVSVNAHTAGLNFLMHLKELAAAPLWIEILRLALDQGQIDQLGLEALGRLAGEYPVQAAGLLAEACARAGVELPPMDESRLAQGFTLATQAQQEQDPMAAAQKMIRAWDCLLGEPS